MIKEKEIAVLQDMKKRKIVPQVDKNVEKDNKKRNSVLGYKSKL